MYKCGTGDGESVCTSVEQESISTYKCGTGDGVSTYKCGTGDGESVCTREHYSLSPAPQYHTADVFTKNTHTTLFILNMNDD